MHTVFKAPPKAERKLTLCLPEGGLLWILSGFNIFQDCPDYFFNISPPSGRQSVSLRSALGGALFGQIHKNR